MNTTNPKFKKGVSDKNWFKKGHKLSRESIEKMIKSKTKYTPEETKQRQKDRKNNPDRIAWKKEYNKSPERKYGVYKSSAKTKHFDFDLTFEQFMTLWQKPCSYCHEEITTIGIDRFNNEIGYTLSNITPCCKICNYMKRELSFDVFLDKCKKITEYATK